jgi:acetoin utilization deacetylase AcuC-like enzyme
MVASGPSAGLPKNRVGWLTHELFSWHDAGASAGTLPVGPEIQPHGAADASSMVQRTQSLFQVSGVLRHLEVIAPQPANDEALALVHTRDHVARIECLAARGGGESGVYAPLGYHSAAAARLAVGAAVDAVRAALGGGPRRSYCLVRPAGHHAEADRAMAFCLLNSVAVAAKIARTLGAERVLIVDWDVHHGNGIQRTFEEDPSVLYVSIHQEGLFPPLTGDLRDVGAGAGRGCTINIPLPPGSGHSAYVDVMERIVAPAALKFAPDLILVAAGQDASAFDPLGRQLCTTDTYRRMTELLCEVADHCCEGRIVAVHEGGYSPWYVPFLVRAIVAELAGLPPYPDPYLHVLKELPGQRLQSHQRRRIEQVLTIHRPFGLI